MLMTLLKNLIDVIKLKYFKLLEYMPLISILEIELFDVWGIC